MGNNSRMDSRQILAPSGLTKPENINFLVIFSILGGVQEKSMFCSRERRLNGFQNRCVRRLIGVKPAFLSRVSNADVLEKARHRKLTTTLVKRRLQLFGKVLRSPEGHPVRVVSLIPRTLEPATNRYVRRVGRPCREWVPEAIRECRSIFGSMQHAQALAVDKNIWNAELYKHFGF